MWRAATACKWRMEKSSKKSNYHFKHPHSFLVPGEDEDESNFLHSCNGKLAFRSLLSFLGLWADLEAKEKEKGFNFNLIYLNFFFFILHLSSTPSSQWISSTLNYSCELCASNDALFSPHSIERLIFLQIVESKKLFLFVGMNFPILLKAHPDWNIISALIETRLRSARQREAN